MIATRNWKWLSASMCLSGVLLVGAPALAQDAQEEAAAEAEAQAEEASEDAEAEEAEEADWMTVYRLSTYLMFLHLTLLPVNMSLYFYIVTICSLFYSDS